MVNPILREGERKRKKVILSQFPTKGINLFYVSEKFVGTIFIPPCYTHHKKCIRLNASMSQKIHNHLYCKSEDKLSPALQTLHKSSKVFQGWNLYVMNSHLSACMCVCECLVPRPIRGCTPSKPQKSADSALHHHHPRHYFHLRQSTLSSRRKMKRKRRKNAVKFPEFFIVPCFSAHCFFISLGFCRFYNFSQFSTYWPNK